MQTYTMSLVQAPSLAVNDGPLSEMRLKSYQADLTPKSAENPVYQYVQCFQTNNGTSLTFSSATQTQQTIFTVSGDSVWNFGRSYMTFDLSATAQAGGATCMHANTIPFDNISLQTVGGTKLAELQNIQRYSVVSQALSTDLEDYLSRGPAKVGTTIANSFYSESKCLQPCGVNSTALVAEALEGGDGAPIAQYVFQNVGGAVDYSTITYSAGGRTDKPFTARQRVLVAGSSANPSVGTILAVSLYIPFSAFLGTLLSLDKDVLLGQNFNLIINWSAWQNYMFGVTGALNGILGVGAVAYAGVVTISNIYLWLAKEMQVDIVDGLRAKMASGYSMIIPYTTSALISTAQAGQWQANQTLVAGMGLSLKRVINIPVNGTDSDARANSGNNVNGALYTRVQSFLNANPIQQVELKCGTDKQDYDYLWPLIKESPAGQSVREFQINPFWIDNFASGVQHAKDFLYNDCVDDGLEIGNAPSNYAIRFTAINAMKLYQFITCARRLDIMPNGIMWGM